MSLSSIKFFYVLAAVGSIVSFLSLAIPWLPWGWVNSSQITTAGQIASGVASTFGLAVAAIALRSYVWSESTERKEIDSIWNCVSTLQKEFGYFASGNSIVTSNRQVAEDPSRDQDVKAILQTELIKSLFKVVSEQCTPEFLDFIQRHRGADAYRALLGLRLGLTVASAEGWSPNFMIQEHLNTSLKCVQDIKFHDIKIDFKK